MRTCYHAPPTKRAPLDLSFVALGAQLYTWGSGYHGQLALGTRQVQTTPAIVSKLLSTQQLLTKVWCGSHHCAGVTADGELYTWGSNRTGCLGRSLPGDGCGTVAFANIVLRMMGFRGVVSSEHDRRCWFVLWSVVDNLNQQETENRERVSMNTNCKNPNPILIHETYEGTERERGFHLYWGSSVSPRDVK